MHETEHKTPEDAAEHAAHVIRKALTALIETDGLDTATALAGAHAEIVSAMVMTYGSEATAERCVNAALRVQHLPSLHEANGLLDRPHGTA